MGDFDHKLKDPPSPYICMDGDLLQELLRLPISWSEQLKILAVIQERAEARAAALEPRNDHRRPRRS